MFFLTIYFLRKWHHEQKDHRVRWLYSCAIIYNNNNKIDNHISLSTYYPKDVSLWLTIIFLVHDPGHLVTMVDFGICGSLINTYYRSTPCIWTLWRWTTIPTGEKRYINTRFHALYKNRRDRQVSASWIPLTQNASALWLRSYKTESLN